MTIKDNVFKDFTRPQLFAFTYKNFGKEGLRKILGGFDGDSGRQYQEKAADELEDIGLPHVAKIVRESAEKMKYTWDESFCPWPEDHPYPIERRAWLENRERDRKEWEAARASRNDKR